MAQRPSFLCIIPFLLVMCLAVYHTLHYHAAHPLQPLSHNSKNPLLFQQIFLNSSDNATLSSFLRFLTRQPHVAGTPAAQNTAHYVLSQLQASGLKTHVSDYKALLSYPAHASLSVHYSNGTSKELPLLEAGETGPVVPPYHAYSPSGTVAARAVFVNYGSGEDYRALGAMGVNVTGCVAVARRGGDSRGGVVRRAEEEGAVAVLLYSGDGGKGIERGTVMGGVGDPQTPGWAAVDGGERLAADDGGVGRRFPKIPSMPISTENARVILGSLGGPRLPKQWMDVDDHALRDHMAGEEKRIATIQNVFAIIRGLEEPDRYVLLGNHRDAWTYGAVDPNSGTAALLDIARRYGILLSLGWKPRRTIVLCSWDAEEFGMIGSTEWVEQNLENLGSKGVAYLNVDCAVQGPGFFARATPQLDTILVEVTKKIKDPDKEGITVYQSWVADRGINIGRLSEVDSDFAAFVQLAGVPSIDLYYGKDYPVYHTAFDSYDWMKKYGDPLFQRHMAVTEIWGLLALRLVDDAVLPFNYLSYGAQLQEHMKALSILLESSISLDPMNTAIQELISASTEVNEEAKKLREGENVLDSLELRRRTFNDRLILAERGFLEREGLEGRQWFKHLIYGPPIDYESKLRVFPGIADAMSNAVKRSKSEGRSEIQHEIWRVARAIQRAAIALRGELT
ncbi:putative glutamate carboxypeptidase 2 isoform X1 [Cinnamomum micranthum f. kanehirae]|uniref:glutamate carboxypeptidase II n=1 Tax=Cinnamomum micranthum f. kanehirae TaxID=337451 RepID=A0A3S4NVE9_9MAGN|nr:putative glutamate carboxypeptidase 2 isoform X1 [Cinnamomum micranthum f. kanehirae]